MAAPSFNDITYLSSLEKQIINKAVTDFLQLVDADATHEEVMQLAYMVGQKYRLLSAELGAQWYEYCARLAGVEIEPAELPEFDDEPLFRHIDEAMSSEDVEKKATELFQNLVASSVRDTGHANLLREYERGMSGARWARVPVGETCAWCLMLASQGAWYHSEETALGTSPDHYHDNCDCIAVFFADANDIAAYDDLAKYKEMYYDADNALQANKSGTDPYPPELEMRIAAAKEEHEQKREQAAARGIKKPKWNKYNELLILMRYQNGLQH